MQQQSMQTQPLSQFYRKNAHAIVCYRLISADVRVAEWDRGGGQHTQGTSAALDNTFTYIDAVARKDEQVVVRCARDIHGHTGLTLPLVCEVAEVQHLVRDSM